MAFDKRCMASRQGDARRGSSSRRTSYSAAARRAFACRSRMDASMRYTSIIATSFGSLRDRVGLRPDADPPVRECLVLVLEQHRAVEVGLDLRAGGDNANRMPDTELRLGDSRGCDRAPLAIHDRIEAEVVLECIGAHEQIVLAVLRAKDDAATRILPPVYGSRAHR